MSRNSYRYKNNRDAKCLVIGCGNRPNMGEMSLCSGHYHRLPIELRQSVYVGSGISEALDFLEKRGKYAIKKT